LLARAASFKVTGGGFRLSLSPQKPNFVRSDRKAVVYAWDKRLKRGIEGGSEVRRVRIDYNQWRLREAKPLRTVSRAFFLRGIGSSPSSGSTTASGINVTTKLGDLTGDPSLKLTDVEDATRTKACNRKPLRFSSIVKHSTPPLVCETRA